MSSSSSKSHTFFFAAYITLHGSVSRPDVYRALQYISSALQCQVSENDGSTDIFECYRVCCFLMLLLTVGPCKNMFVVTCPHELTMAALAYQLESGEFVFFVCWLFPFEFIFVRV